MIIDAGEDLGEETVHDEEASDDSDGSDNDSSSAGDQPVGSKFFRIKLQNFDGTGSWESWWAHFENCASYNKWNERDKLAFMKGALSENAAEVLWDHHSTIAP